MSSRLPDNLMGASTPSDRASVAESSKGRFPTFALATRQRMPKVDQVIEYARAVYNGDVTEEEVY